MLSRLTAYLGIFGTTFFVFPLANGKCCKQQNVLNSCKGCIGWDNDNDNKIDWYMNIGIHGGKKCKNGNTNDNCDEEKRTCATVSNLTKFNTRIAGVCTGANGVATGPYTISVMQCGVDDDQCSEPEPVPEGL